MMMMMMMIRPYKPVRGKQAALEATNSKLNRSQTFALFCLPPAPSRQTALPSPPRQTRRRLSVLVQRRHRKIEVVDAGAARYGGRTVHAGCCITLAFSASSVECCMLLQLLLLACCLVIHTLYQARITTCTSRR